MRPLRPALAAALAAAVLVLAHGLAAAQALKAITVARGLVNPWGLAFLPDGRMLVTERPGRLRVVTPDGRLGEPLQGLPAVEVGGQGGLLDVAIDPRFAANGLVYWSFSETDPQGGRGNSTAVARGRLDGNRLVDVRVIFRQAPKFASSAHFGSRLVFAPDGRLFVTLGDRFLRRDDAQSLANHHGKIVRIESDGRVPADNPFVGRAGALPEIWSYGHRNVQGAAINPATGELWVDEHGPQGGDELNVVLAGRNYGWPVITYGAEYVTGAKIGAGASQSGLEQPLTYWVPSIATSGLAFLTSDRYPGWKGSAFIGALKAQLLVRLELGGRRAVREERLLQDLGERIRDVRQGPDGWLYVLTDSANGRILRLER
ncbi:MAG TPA: PQQ-dependent sugar dehydrogenase [Burkholderiaceae bacterium]|nr:PQQ-dependent sugar dehydrogenase [Burkholderiaceae bacterium]